MKADVSMADLESVLSLPIWKKRYELYSVWIATEIIRALEGHDVKIHHDNGRMDFGFHETEVATVRSSPGPFRLVSERRVPLAKPKGKGRTAGVQPDHGLWKVEGSEDVCHLAVEVKHYKKEARGKFVDVFEDYARAIPDGEVYLVNHGPTGRAIQRRVEGSLRSVPRHRKADGEQFQGTRGASDGSTKVRWRADCKLGRLYRRSKRFACACDRHFRVNGFTAEVFRDGRLRPANCRNG